MCLLERFLRPGRFFTETELYRGDDATNHRLSRYSRFSIFVFTPKTPPNNSLFCKQHDFYGCCPITKTAAKYHSPKYGATDDLKRCDYTMHMQLHMWFEYVHPVTSQLEYFNNFDIGHKIFIRYTG